jgi:AraC-like DNA-binding protein
MAIDTSTRFLFDSRVSTPLGSVGGSAIYHDSRWDFEGPRTIYYYTITYVLEGRCLYKEPTGRQTIFTPGDLFFCFPGIPHRLDPLPNEQFSELWISFQGRVFDLWRETNLLDPSRLSLRLEPVEYWLGRFESLFVNVRHDVNGQIMLISALQSLLAEAMSVQPPPTMTADEMWLSEAKGLLDAVFRADDLDLPAIAAQMGVSYSTFRRRFTTLAGMSPGKYHTAKLMQRVCEWLHSSSAATREAAQWFGFADESHFYKRFRDVVGVSPKQFREQLQEGAGHRAPRRSRPTAINAE